MTVKQNFRSYNRQHTSPNKNFEYSYPLLHLGWWKGDGAGEGGGGVDFCFLRIDKKNDK